MRCLYLIVAGLVLAFSAPGAGAVESPDMVLMVLDQNAYVVDKALQGLDKGLDLDVRVVTVEDVTQNPEAVQSLVHAASVIVVDVMGRALDRFVREHVNAGAKIVYALRGSLDDESLKKRGSLFCPVLAGKRTFWRIFF